VGLLAHSIAALVTTPVAGARALAPLLRQPRVLARRAGRALRGAVALGASVVPVAPTSLAGPLSRQRRFTSVTVPMADVRAVRAVLPGTVNDVALTSVAGGFRALLLARGERPDAHAVRTLVPVSARQPGEETIPDNRVSLLLVHLPVDVDDPVARLREVRRRVAAAGAAGEAEAGATLTSIAGVEPFLPVALGVRLAFHLPQRHLVTVTTNVPGPRLPVYALGRRCVRIIPYVPIADRVRVGVAVFSYADELVFCITADYDTEGDLDVLAGGARSTPSWQPPALPVLPAARSLALSPRAERRAGSRRGNVAARGDLARPGPSGTLGSVSPVSRRRKNRGWARPSPPQHRPRRRHATARRAPAPTSTRSGWSRR
jgi:diacylglycerol O-acyltransferase